MRLTIAICVLLPSVIACTARTTEDIGTNTGAVTTEPDGGKVRHSSVAEPATVLNEAGAPLKVRHGAGNTADTTELPDAAMPIKVRHGAGNTPDTTELPDAAMPIKVRH